MDKDRIRGLWGAGVATVGLAGLILLVQLLADRGRVERSSEIPREVITVFPDFASIQDLDLKKQQFFDYLQAYIDAENRRIAGARERLLDYVEILSDGGTLSAIELDAVQELANRYEINTDASATDTPALLNSLLRRVDVIPTSLVLAQAANESAWGTSRFVLEGFNLFGQWCFEEGCGFVPQRREAGATHEVKRFDSIEDAIESYFLNINTHYSYRFFRDLRREMRKQARKLDPVVLAFGLGRYSERGDNYIDEVQNIIIQNALTERDSVHSPV